MIASVATLPVGQLVVVDLHDAKGPLDVLGGKLRFDVAGGRHGL